MSSKYSIFFMLLSIFAFTLMNVIVKQLNNFSTYQLLFFRAFGTLVFTVPLLIRLKIPVLGTQKKLLLLRGTIGSISVFCFFKSLNYLPIGTSVSLRYISPIFAAIFALYFLKERIKSLQWLLFLIAFIGVLLVKGLSNNLSSIGLLLIIISAIFQGLVFVIIRKIGNKEHPLVIVNYFMILIFAFGGIMSINNWITPTIWQGTLLFGLGFLGYIGQFYMTKAFQNSSTNKIAPLKNLEVIFTVIFGVFWFDENYSLINYIGILLIVFAVTYNVILKRSSNS